MQNGLVQVICQIGIFVICAQAIVHFRPKASYEKYLKLLVSAMMVLQIFLFLGGIFSADGKKELAERTQWFADSLEKGMRQAAENVLWDEENVEMQIKGALMQDGGDAGVFSDKMPTISIQIEKVDPIRIGSSH